MTLTRNQLITSVAAVAVLIGLTAYISRRTSETPPAAQQVMVAPLPIANVQGLSAEQQMQVTGLSVGAMMAVFLHETGHMLISELKLPAVGPQEDVADEFATYAMAEAVIQAPENDKNMMADIAYSGALFWKLAAQQQEKGGGGAWYDEHSPSERRYANILCLMTGADPLRFIPRAVKDGVPEQRLQRCAEEYRTKKEAWDRIMKPHEPGRWDKLFGTHHLTVEYGPVMKAEWGAFENVYRQGTLFQPVFDSIGQGIVLPQDIPVVLRGCGQVNAWWSPDEKKITLCHDFFAHLTETFARAFVAAQQAQQQPQNPNDGRGGGQPPGGGGGEPAPAGGVSMAALAGSWSCDGVVNGMRMQQQMLLRPNGTFQVQAFANGQAMSAWGRWSVQASVMRIDYDGPAGVPTPEFIPVQMPAQNILQTATGTCRKAG